MKTYNEIIGDLSFCLNSGYITKEVKNTFVNSLKELKEKYQIKVSTYFLRSFFNPAIPQNKRTKRIYSLIKLCDLKTSYSGYSYDLKSLDTPTIEVKTFCYNPEKCCLNPYGVVLKDIRVLKIGKEKRKTALKILKFIDI